MRQDSRAAGIVHTAGGSVGPRSAAAAGVAACGQLRSKPLHSGVRGRVRMGGYY